MTVETCARLIRDRLARLRALSPDAAREVEGLWPLTLATLDDPDGGGHVLGRRASRMREDLAAELAERIAEAEEVA